MTNSKKKRLYLIIAIILVILAVPSTVYGINYKQYKGNIDKAIAQINEEKYDEAINDFTKISNTYFGKKNHKEIKNNIENAKKFKEDKKTYDEALKLIDNKKYLEAIEILKKIPKEDKKRYELAKKKTEECKTLYVALYIQKGKNEAKEGRYDDAINFFTLALKIDPDNKEASALKKEYIKAKAEIVAKAKEEADQKAEAEKKAAASKAVENNIPKERPFTYIAPMLNVLDGKITIKPGSEDTLSENYYDRDAKVEIVVYLKSGVKHYYGKVGQQISIPFSADDEVTNDNEKQRKMGFGKYDLIITDKYGVFKTEGPLIKATQYIPN